MNPRAMQKRTGLAGIRRAVEMPLPSMMTKPKEEVKEAIKKALTIYKPK
jgi:hypothetical protein